MDDLLLECSIHLDGVPLKDMRTFKCGHGFCITCINTLFNTGASSFKCPTCRKCIHREDALQIFLTPHRSPTQHTTQSSRGGSDVDLTLLDDSDLTVEGISRLRKKARAYATEQKRLRHGYVQLKCQVMTVNEERDALRVNYRALQQKDAALEAQHAALKSDCIKLKNQRSKSRSTLKDLLGMYDTAASDAQRWKESCKKAQADALAVLKEKEIHDKVMEKLAEREREFKRCAHATKIAWQYELDKYKNECDALRQELSQLQNNSTNRRESRKAVLVVDRGVVDELQHAVMECLRPEGTASTLKETTWVSQARRMLARNSRQGQVMEKGHNTTI
ncbi:hypothetical protein M405DRAFT_813805 [Rhizopogon salebrosus TDB-379]|nr:hypothetical protein M405DRAFT_813805 [Rhizopogon salebrosus TDB-379]